jgi:diguanylate cyclase (GGDEF)-like protein
MNRESRSSAASSEAEATRRERERLAELHRYEILDTPPEESFDRLVAIASYICDTPISLISLVDETRQWFKARQGLDASEAPRSVAFCAHAIASDDLMIVENAADDGRFAENPLVTGEPKIRFYAGAPLRSHAGARLGTLCVIDRKPRVLTAEQRARLADLAAIAVDEMELRLKNRRLAELNRMDPMIGIYNRLHFMEAAEIERVRSNRYNRPFSILSFDIDHFKKVNDSWGHAAGDAVLIGIAREAKALLRRQDLLARMGGEEFAILMPETNREGGEVIAERLRARIAEAKFRHEAADIAVTVSIGVAEADQAADIAEVLKEADAALYEAKRSGRNRVVVARETPA